MEQKAKLPRKKSIDIKNLPTAPELPATPHQRPMRNEKDPYNLLYNFRERKSTFLDSLNENIKIFDSENSSSCDASTADMSNDVNKKSCEDECLGYIEPLMNRTNESVSALLATKDSLDQLDNLHRIVKQLLSVQEQNYLMRKRLRTVKTLQALKSMEIQINSNPEKFIKDSLEDGSDVDMNELEENMANLENIIAAGASASNKRNSSKKLRSKSIISEDFNITSGSMRENDRNYPLRRQSAISDFKPKVSKWTKVKAAFKWEKANALPLSESKSSDSVLSPTSSEVARYLRVPSASHAACSSGDSLFSLSSGRMGTPPEISSAANSSADENEDEKIMTRKIRNEDERRSYSIDVDGLLYNNDKSSGKNKSAWSKVKGIVTSRNSRKSLKSVGSVNSRDVSPIDLIDAQIERTDSVSSSNQPSPSHCLNVLENELANNTSSGYSHNQGSSDDNNDSKLLERKQIKSNWVQRRIPVAKKTKHVPEIESLPEGVTLESKSRKKSIPNPLNLNKEFSESDGLEGLSNNSPNVKITKIHRKSSSSLPNSPSKAGEFFSENEFSSGGDYSPLKRDSNNSSLKSTQEREQDEILKNYKELQKKISEEFEKKKVEWEKMRPLVIQLTNSFPTYLKDDLSLPGTPKSIVNNLAFNEENLSADFKKKLDEWRMMKNQQTGATAPKPESGPKKQTQLDWQLWRTGQMKFDNQGLMALPDTKDLPEDFQKKLNEWKQMKTEGRVPSYNHQTSVHEKMKRQFSKSDSKSSSTNSSLKKSKTCDDKKIKALVTEPVSKEIVVRTSIGTMTFQGISRKFTRKLYEWEKAQGIAPESSTFALLHPEYKALLEDKMNDDREKSPGLKRCLSVDSVKPSPSQVDLMTHQPSSLSLNDAENFKENEDNRRVASNIEIYEHQEEESENVETPHSEPEAMLVEIEDESCEPLTISNATTPVTQMQIPIFKFDFANRDSKHDPSDNIQAIKEILDVYDKASNSILNIYQKSEVSITSIKHLTNIFKYINHSLVQLRESTKEYNSNYLDKALHYSDDIAKDFEIIDNQFNEVSVQEKLPEINGKNCQLKDALVNFESYYMQNHMNAIGSFQAKRTIQNSSEKGVAICEVTPTFVCNAIKTEDDKSKNLLKASDSENPVTSDVISDDKMSKKVSRNTSNGSKRKVRLRRMGSRQSSKTESDSEAESNTNPDTTRKSKRKSNRSKKPLESDKSFDSFQGDDEVVYMFKIKPGEKNEMTTLNKTVEPAIIDEEPSHQIPVEVSNEQNQNNLAVVSNAIVKTKRRIFTPVDVEGETVNASVSHEIDSSSASTSDKNEIDKKQTQLQQQEFEVESDISTSTAVAAVANPNHTQSPKMSKKDMSPNIRLMIDRYHLNLDKKSTSPNSSGSCSPIWRSPIMDRRVRKQSIDYQHKILKSSSFQEVQEIDINDKPEVNNNNETKFEEPVQVPENLTQEIIVSATEKEEEIEEPIVRVVKASSSGAIPKRIESPVTSEEYHSMSPVTLRNDKPRTPLSERAMKIQKAKEAFLKMPVGAYDSCQSDWNYRLSQISVGSTDTSDAGSLIKCLSARTLNERRAENQDDTSESKSSSLPRHSNAESLKDETKNSRFGLSTITSKLRKVKLKRNGGESSKMNTIPILVRQSLAVDFSSNAESSDSTPHKSAGKSRFKKNNNIKKSKSLGLLE